MEYKYIPISYPLGYTSLNINPIRYQPRNKREIHIKPKWNYS